MRLAEFARRTGSEVMGPLAPSRQLSPTADSLQGRAAGPSSSMPLHIQILFITLSRQRTNVNPSCFTKRKGISPCFSVYIFYENRLTNESVCG